MALIGYKDGFYQKLFCFDKNYFINCYCIIADCVFILYTDEYRLRQQFFNRFCSLGELKLTNNLIH